MTKKWVRVSVLCLAMALVFAACENPAGSTNKDESGIDYENYVSSYSIKVKNDANKKLVAFKGAPSASSLISGVPIGGGEHGLKKDSALFSSTGDFVLFLVTEEDYLANKNNLSSLANRPFTRIYAYFNAGAENKLVYTISGFLGGSKKIVLQNNTSFNVELRKDGIQGELIGYAASTMTNTVFNVAPDDYNVFPIFRKFNPDKGEIVSVYPKYNSPDNAKGKAKFKRFTLDDSLNEAQILAGDFLGSDIDLKTGSAYLVINNNHRDGMSLLDGVSKVTTSTGGQMINSNKTLVFQIDMPKKFGSTDEYLDTTTKGGFRISSDMHAEDIPSQEFETDIIYELNITGENPYDIKLSSITKIGEMKFKDL